jgi:hypothetical protein
MPETLIPQACRTCHSALPPDAFFCPHCGARIRRTPPQTAWYIQLWIYAVSLLAPPFGLWYVWTYGRTQTKIHRGIAVIALLLTIASLAITIQTTRSILRLFEGSLTPLGF